MTHHPVGWSNPYPCPILSIPTASADARFRYSPDFSGCGPSACREIVTITMTGKRSEDNKRSNAQAHLASTPVNYTWHHLYMTTPANNLCTMQLVLTSLHRSTCPHLGGFAQFIAEDDALQAIRAQFRMSEEERALLREQARLHAAQNDLAYAPPLPASAVDRLTEGLALDLPSPLKDFYRDGHRVASPVPCLTAADCTYLIHHVYPLARGEGVSESLEAVVEEERQRAGGPMLYARDGAIPIADDPFGNVYFLPAGAQSVCFYDHEDARAFDTHIPVDQFMNQLFA